MSLLRRHAGLLLTVLAAIAYSTLLPPLYRQSRPTASAEMQVALPRFVQVIMAGGDRYLAANIAGFRSLLASTENMGPENYRILGIVQSDVSWFNPAHEDNYYIATAILPWFGEVKPTQYVLRRASDARPFDWQPAFYYAFNALHFEKNPQEAALWLQEASRHTTDENEQIGMQQIAAIWGAKGDDLQFAIRLHRTMAKETKHRGFAKFLEKRAIRLENQVGLDEAVTRFQKTRGQLPQNLDDLVVAGILDQLPVDPFGGKYILGKNQRVEVVFAGAGNLPKGK